VVWSEEKVKTRHCAFPVPLPTHVKREKTIEEENSIYIIVVSYNRYTFFHYFYLLRNEVIDDMNMIATMSIILNKNTYHLHIKHIIIHIKCILQ